MGVRGKGLFSKSLFPRAILHVRKQLAEDGLEIIRFLERHSRLVLAEGTIYPILNRLKAEGMLTSEWVEAEAGHPRKYYSLTGEGRKRLRLMAAAWVSFSQGLSQLLEPVLETKEIPQ